MKYLSLFSGIGGFELGIQQAHESNHRRLLQSKTTENLLGQLPDTSLGQDRTTCIGYSEIDKYASQIYQSHFPNHKNYGDITKIKAEDLPEFDLIVGGFPCQSFSIAGKRGGFADTRGTLFFDIARIIKAKQPRLLLLENVKGLLSHDKGDTFRVIIATLDELGYDLQWQVLNSKNFGVPQNRERVFIVGHLRGTGRPEVFPFGEGNKEYARGLQQLNTPKFSSNRIYSKRGISPNIRTMQGGNLQPKVMENICENCEGRGDINIGANVCWKCDGTGVKIRRLTPTECERLQGFPNGWTEGVSDTQRYKTLGNAVTVNVIKNLIEKTI